MYKKKNKNLITLSQILIKKTIVNSKSVCESFEKGGEKSFAHKKKAVMNFQDLVNMTLNVEF